MKNLVNQPDAKRLIFGLRDTGYNFNTAAADIIDNSIAANADEVNVRIELETDGRKYVYFGDNGDGMDEPSLFSAMRYGAAARENLGSLGKFGLGMKTASSSVCLKFTVISRQSADSEFHKLSWDLEHVEHENEWEMLEEPLTEDESEVFSELCGEKGTLVIWSKCDRILTTNYGEDETTKELQAIRRLAERLKDHAALIYYRFLDEKDDRERTVKIAVNGEPVLSWNPFFPEKSEQVLPDISQTLEIVLEDKTVETAKMRAWILPNRRDLTSEEIKIANITNARQGFYIHREGRVIQQGGWLGVFGAPEPHTSLLRVEFDFDHKLDDAFEVDVMKSRVKFDPGLREGLQKMLHPVYREAGNRYRRKEKVALVEKGIDHGSANKVISKTPSTKRPDVIDTAPDQKSATINNNRGPNIKLRIPVDPNVDPDKIHVEAVDSITTGNLWEAAMRSEGETGFVVGVRLSKHHDFYQKIYQRAASNGYTVEGMDLLLWAFATAEQNNSNPELEPIFEDIRDEISNNLTKLLRDVPLPEERDLNDDED
jgi:hypothetical protein